MDTKELLQLAAKACGIVGQVKDHGGQLWLLNREDYGDPWNPAADQADSDRMGTKLRMDVFWRDRGVSVDAHLFGIKCLEFFADHNGDENAALRAARLRCAAEIGNGVES